jgi:hypothetical protein
MSGLDNCQAITNDNHYLMGPPGGVAFHGAARSRESAGFLDPWSSSSFAQVVDFIEPCFAMMSNWLKALTIMDQEIASLKLNINQLAGITNVHRQTVAARLKNVEPAPGSNSKLKLYLVTDVLTELMIPTVATNLEDMPPADRLAHWKAENERIKFEQDTGQLIPADEVARSFQ